MSSTLGQTYSEIKNLDQLGGKFKVVGKISAGASGTVWKVLDPEGKEIALKALKPSFFEKDVPKLERFKREFDLLKKVSHPNIARIYDFGFDETHKLYYYTSELLLGGDLNSVVGKTIEKIERLLLDALRALEYLKTFGILHLDVKPQNLLLRGPESEELVLIDFGLASLKPPNKPGGTPSYMPPEVIRRKLAPDPGALSLFPLPDHRSDIYSLGVSFYYALTGVRPFSILGSNKKVDIDATLTRHLKNEKPPPPSSINPKVPAYLDAIIMKMIEHDPSERYQSALFASQMLCFRSPNRLNPETKETIGSYLPEEGMIVGRRSELDLLQEAVSSASRGSDEAAHLVCIAGASGTGKTRLLNALKPIAQKNEMEVLHDLRATDWNLTRKTAFILDDPFLPASMIDDFSMSDVMLLKKIATYVREMPKSKVAVIFTINTDFISIDEAIRALGADERSCQIVHLKNFTEAETAEYLKRILGEEPKIEMAHELHHVTYGNPRFITDIFKRMIEKGELFPQFLGRPDAKDLASTDFSFTHVSSPASLSEHISELMETLPSGAQELAAVLASLRRPASISELDRFGMGRTVADDFAALFSSGLVKEPDNVTGFVNFENPLAPKIIEKNLKEQKRAALHDLVARAIEDGRLASGNDTDPEFEMILHRALGSDAEKQKHAALELADEARKKMHPAAAVELMGDVLNAVPPSDWETKVKLVISEIKALSQLGRTDEAKNAIEKLAGLSNDPAVKKKLLMEESEQLGILNTRMRKLSEARENFQTALNIANELQDGMPEEKELANIRLENSLAGVDFRDGKIDRAIEKYKDTALRALKLGPQNSEKITNNELGECLFMSGRFEEAIEVLKEDLNDPSIQKRPEAICTRLRLIGNSMRKMDEGHLKEVEEHYGRALALAKKYYLFDHQLRIRNGMGNLYMQMCEWERAVEEYRHAIDLAIQLEGKVTAVDITANMGLALNRLGRWNDAIENLEMALDFAKGPEAEGIAVVKYTMPSIHVALANAHYEKKEFDDALSHLEIALGLDKATKLDPTLRFNLYGTLTEVALVKKDSSSAQKWLKTLEKIAEGLPELREHFEKLDREVKQLFSLHPLPRKREDGDRQ